MIGVALESTLALAAWAFVCLVGPFLCLLVHESAHAVVGRLCGFDVIEVQFGSGPAWWARWFGRIRITFHNWPTHGHVVALYRGERWMRTRIALFALAGPVSNLALFAAAWAWAAVAGDPWQFVAMFCVMQTGWITAWSFVPRTLRNGAKSDLQIVLAVARLDPSTVPTMVAHYGVLAAHHECQRAFELGRLDVAEGVLAAHRGDPVHVGWTGSMAILLALSRGDPQRALVELDRGRAALLAVVNPPAESAAAPRELGLEWEINRAFVMAAIGTEEATAAAMRLVSSWPSARHARGESAVAAQRTRGLVLLRRGSVGHAIVCLRAALRGHEPHWLRALGMAHLAEAFVHTRHFDEAARWARKARRLDPTGPLLPLFLRPVEAALAQRRAPAAAIR